MFFLEKGLSFFEGVVFFIFDDTMKANKEHIAVSENGTVILTSATSVMSVQGAGAGLKSTSKVKHTAEKDPRTMLPGSRVWAPWGDEDDLPIKLMETVGKIGVLGSALDINASLHYGNGIIWGRDVFGTDADGKPNGKKTFMPESVAAWDRLKRTCEIDIIQSEIIDSLENFYISFPEVILNNGRDRIESVKVLDTCYCRFELRKANGRIENVYFDTDFGTGSVTTPSDKIPVYDPSDPQRFQRFVFPIQYRSWGKFYYPEQLYYTCIRNGYADIAIAIPKMLKYIYANQMTLKYIIRVPYSVMAKKYSNWDTPPDCDTAQQVADWQLAKMKEFQDEINTHLTDVQYAGQGILTFTDSDRDYKGIEVEPIKSYLDTSKELPTASAANQELLFAAQLDPSILGLGVPGGKNLSGSGSDKRESLNIKQAMLKRERLISLRLPNLLAVIENFNDDALYPTYMDMDASQTLDENPTGKQNIVS